MDNSPKGKRSNKKKKTGGQFTGNSLGSEDGGSKSKDTQGAKNKKTVSKEKRTGERWKIKKANNILSSTRRGGGRTVREKPREKVVGIRWPRTREKSAKQTQKRK